MAVPRCERQPVHLLEPVNDRERGVVEGHLLLERVQHNALEEVTEGEIEILGKTLENLDQPPLHPDARLDPLDRYHSTNVPESLGKAASSLPLLRLVRGTPAGQPPQPRGPRWMSPARR